MIKAGEYFFAITLSFKLDEYSASTATVGVNGTTTTDGNETRMQVFNKLAEVCKLSLSAAQPGIPVTDSGTVLFFTLEPN